LSNRPTSVLRRCSRCFEAPGGTQLKRCTGCAFALYCSKECQKAAWPKHKIPCVYHVRHAASPAIEDAARRFGYRNIIEIRQALEDFVDANTWAFIAFSKALVIIEHGLAEIHRHPPRHLEVSLMPAGNPRTRSPAHTFMMYSTRWFMLDELMADAEGWEASEPERERIIRRYLRNSDQPFTGLRVIRYQMHGIDISMTSFYPRFEPTMPLHAVLPSSTELVIGQILADVVTLTEGSINTDMAFGPRHDETSKIALPGRLVRLNNECVWEASFASWVEVETEDGELVVPVRELDLLQAYTSRLNSELGMCNVLGYIQ
ncbi:hypothetical protein BD310DRAFT_768491, partial [Dichomitus squalens]